MQLSEEQLDIFGRVVEAVESRRRQQVIVAGSAGTGKTTLLSALANDLKHFAPVVWTGKAARRMQEVGIPHAETIHSTIYNPVVEKGKVVDFILKNRSDLFCDGFLVDEASTISQELYNDLMSFGLPCVFVGDHKQLEPIGSDLNLMRNPDFTLETIHRNAGDIAHFAERVSRGDTVGGYQSKQVTLIPKREVTDDLLLSVDQVICAYNMTRVGLNDRIRDALDLPEGKPVVGDRIICLKNKRKLGVFNGMQGVITRIDDKLLSFDADGVPYTGIPYLSRQFGEEQPVPQADYVYSPVPFDWAYACTAHKFQGSEGDRILVYVQECRNWDHRRWAYTAASRAKKHLIWAM